MRSRSPKALQLRVVQLQTSHANSIETMHDEVIPRRGQEDVTGLGLGTMACDPQSPVLIERDAVGDVTRHVDDSFEGSC